MEKQKIVDLYNQNIPIAEIARKTGYSLYVVRNYLKKNTNYIVNKGPRELEQKVLKLYNSGIKNCWDISKSLNTKYGTILYVMRRLKLENEERELYHLDENFFEKIDTQQKAYLLGIMYSDGCVYKNTMIIGVTDKEIVENAKRFLNYEGPIEEYKKDNKCKLLYKLRVKRKKIFDDLINKGCVPKKSLILDFPNSKNVPNSLIHHFIRGVFDGDGCISNYDGGDAYITKKWVITITGTKEVLDGIVEKSYITPCWRHITKNKNTWSFFINKKVEIERFINYIYKDSTVSLTRKRLLCEQFLKEYNE